MHHWPSAVKPTTLISHQENQVCASLPTVSASSRPGNHRMLIRTTETYHSFTCKVHRVTPSPQAADNRAGFAPAYEWIRLSAQMTQDRWKRARLQAISRQVSQSAAGGWRMSPLFMDGSESSSPGSLTAEERHSSAAGSVSFPLTSSRTTVIRCSDKTC